MAIYSGVGPHYAVLNVNGAQFLIEKGSVHLTATKKSGTFNATIPLGLPGAAETIGSLGDNQTSILVSARGQTAVLITGEIDDTDFDFIGGTITVSGRDASAKLHDTKSAEKWVNKQPDEIITDLAGRVGLGTNIQSLGIKMQRTISDDYTKLTDNITYASVIHKLCEFMQAHWFVQGSTLNVVMGDDAVNGGYSINYSRDGNNKIVSDALQLKVKRNVQAGKPIKATVKSWHHHEKKKYTGENTVGGNGTTREYTYHLPNLTQEHVDQHAKAKSKDHARHELQLTAELVGDPSINIANGIQLNGTIFTQNYTIDSLEHEFGQDGYTMHITAKAPGAGRGV